MEDHAPRHRSYDPEIELCGETRSSRPLAPYQPRRSDRAGYSEPSVPLYLSDSDGVPDPSEYISPLMKGRASYYALRILAGALGGIAIAGLAALASSDSARELMASAKASSIAALSVASVAMQPSPAPSKPAADIKETTQPSTEPLAQSATDDNQSPAAETTAAGSAASGTIMVAAATPTRDDIKTAYQGALQGTVPQAAAAPDAAPADVIHHLDASEIAALLKRAETLIGSGDLAAARLVLRRAAEAGDARAAMMLGGTYDPSVLEKLGVRGVVPDLAMARRWYDKAKRFGATETTPRLDTLARKQN